MRAVLNQLALPSHGSGSNTGELCSSLSGWVSPHPFRQSSQPHPPDMPTGQPGQTALP